MPEATATPAASTIVLPALPANSKVTYYDDAIVIGKSFHAQDSYFRYRGPQEFASHPSYWHQFLARTDAHGRRWTANDGIYLTDDFGALVPVPRGLQ